MSNRTFLLALMIVCGSCVLIAALRFARAYFEGRVLRTPPPLPTGLQERLDRIEIAVEATAVEVERIAEGNRFMSKLLAERTAALKPPNQPERVITPH